MDKTTQKGSPALPPHSQPTAYRAHATQPTVPSAKRSQSATGFCRRACPPAHRTQTFQALHRAPRVLVDVAVAPLCSAARRGAGLRRTSCPAWAASAQPRRAGGVVRPAADRSAGPCGQRSTDGPLWSWVGRARRDWASRHFHLRSGEAGAAGQGPGCPRVSNSCHSWPRPSAASSVRVAGKSASSLKEVTDSFAQGMAEGEVGLANEKKLDGMKSAESESEASSETKA